MIVPIYLLIRAGFNITLLYCVCHILISDSNVAHCPIQAHSQLSANQLVSTCQTKLCSYLLVRVDTIHGYRPCTMNSLSQKHLITCFFFYCVYFQTINSISQEHRYLFLLIIMSTQSRAARCFLLKDAFLCFAKGCFYVFMYVSMFVCMYVSVR